MKTPACLALMSLLWIPGAFAADAVCSTGEPQVKEALGALNSTWGMAQDVAPFGSWRLSTTILGKEPGTRSAYEVYATYAGLIYRLGIPPYTALTTLTEAGHIGEDEHVEWGADEDALFAQAALVRGKSAYFGFKFAERLASTVSIFSFRSLDWEKADLARVAATALIVAPDLSEAGLKAQAKKTVEIMEKADQLTGVPEWFVRNDLGRLSMLAEAALFSGQEPRAALDRLNEIFAASTKLPFTLDAVDTYLLVRAALVANVDAKHVVDVLQKTYELSHFKTNWEARDYAKVAAAVILSGRTDFGVGAEVMNSVLEHATIAPNWNHPDYSQVAANVVLGPVTSCAKTNLYW